MPIYETPIAGPKLPTQPVLRPSTAGSVDSFGSLGAISRAPFQWDTAWRWTSPVAPGKIGQMPTSDLIAHDVGSSFWTDWGGVKSPRVSVLSPSAPTSLFGKPGKVSGVGNFNMSMVEPWWSAEDAVAGGLGQGTGQDYYGTPAAWFEQLGQGNLLGGTESFAQMAMTAPSLMLNRGLAISPAALLLRGLGISVGQQSDQTTGENRFPFQQDPHYYPWLATATDQQLRQQANAVAAGYVNQWRASGLADMLYNTFIKDKQAAVGLSSGDDQVDYRSKKAFGAERELWQQAQRGGYAGTFADYLALGEGDKLRLGFDSWGPSENTPQAIASKAFGMTIGGTRAMAEAGILYAPGGTGLLNNIWGTGIGLDPVGQDVEDAWNALDPKTRANYLRYGGDTRMVSDFVLGMVSIGVSGGVRAALQGASALSTGARAGAVAANAWNKSLWINNLIQAQGMAYTIASGVIQAAAPTSPIVPYLQEIDNARPLSGSIIGDVLTIQAGFASGTAGLWTVTRGVGAGLRLADSGVGKMPSVNIAGHNLGVPHMGTRENEFWSVHFGGSEMEGGHARFAQWAEPGSIRSDVTNTMFSFLHRVVEAGPIDTMLRAALGKETTPFFDNLTAEEKVGYLLDRLDSITQNRAQRVLTWMQVVRDASAPHAMLATAQDIMRTQKLRGFYQSTMQSVMTAYGKAYGFAGDIMPKTVPDLIEFTRHHWAALDELTGKKSDFDGFQRWMGTGEAVGSAERWMQAARVAQGRLFYMVHGNIEAIKDSGTTAEDSLTTWSQRAMFYQDALEAATTFPKEGKAQATPEAEQALLARLMEKRAVRELYAQHKYGSKNATFDVTKVDTEELAIAMSQVADSLPVRRDTPTGPGELNDLHRRIEAQGLYTLGYRRRIELPDPAISYLKQLGDMMSVQELAMRMPDRVMRADVPPDGYVEMPAGIRFRLADLYKRLDPYLTSDGRAFVRKDLSLMDENGVPIFGSRVQRPAAAGSNRDVLVDLNGRVVPITQDPGLLASLPEPQRILATEGADFGTLQGHAYPRNEFGLEETGEVVSGNNPGANYPVYIDPLTDVEYVFKAGRGGAPGSVDQTPTRIWAGIAASKIARYLIGPTVSTEVPFEMNGVRGTLQERFEFTGQNDGYLPVESGGRKDGWYDWSALSPETQGDLIKTVIVDWLTAQHDTNNDSSRLAVGLGGNEIIVHFDKGQAYAFQQYGPGARGGYSGKQVHEQNAFDEGDLFSVNQWGNANRVLSDQLGHAVEQGHALPWDPAESILQAIEAMPDDVYLAALEPLVNARAADTTMEWASPEEFYQWALDRKHGMREAVAKAYDKAGLMNRPYPDRLIIPALAEGEMMPTPDSTIPLNYRPPLSLPDLRASGAYDDILGLAGDRKFDEPADTIGTPTKAGVIVLEDFAAMADGSEPQVWVMHPRNEYGGYTGTFSKGGIDAGETPREAAYREAGEELGLGVRLTGHLMDGMNSDGSITRYYVGERVSGGPKYMHTHDLGRGVPETEASHVSLSPHGLVDEALGYTGPGNVAGMSARDADIVKVLAQHIAQERANIAARLAGSTTGGADPSIADPNVPPDMAIRPAKRYGYTNYVKLPSGEIFRSPWLDVQHLEKGAIDLGNRGALGHLYDTVFRGFRTDRMAELQRAGLHLRVSKVISTARAEQINGFYRDLQALQYSEVIGPQGASIHPSMQLLAWSHPSGIGVTELAVKWFGDGPYMGADHVARQVDWPHLVAQSFRQAVKLNLTGGFTSYLKSMKGVGSKLTYMTDFWYPLARFNLSPLFKGGERAESFALNGMNFGVLSSDNVADALMSISGMRMGRATAFEDLQTDQAMASISGIIHRSADQAPTTASTFVYRPMTNAQLADAYANVIGARSAYTPGRVVSPFTSVTGKVFHAPDPALFPDILSPQVGPHIPPVIDPATGEPMRDANGDVMLDLSPEHARLAAEHGIRSFRDTTQQQMRDLPAEQVGRGYALLAALPDGAIERIADTVPLTHMPGGGNVGDQIRLWLEPAVRDDMTAFTTMEGHGTASIATKENVGGGTTLWPTGSRPATSAEETARMMLTFFSAGGTTDWQSRGMMVVAKPEVARDAIIVQTDRYSATGGGNSDWSRFMQSERGVITPAGMNAIFRTMVEGAILRFGSEANYLAPDYTLGQYIIDNMAGQFGASRPIEATTRGIDFDGIAALLMPSSQVAEWTAFVDAHADLPRFQKVDANGNVTGNVLRDIRVVPVDDGPTSTSGTGWLGYAETRKAFWSFIGEKSGQQDIFDMAAGDVAARFDEKSSLAALPKEEYQGDPVREEKVAADLEYAANTAGFDYSYTYGPQQTFEAIRAAIFEQLRKDETTAHSAILETKSQTPWGRSAGESAKEDVVKLRGALAELDRAELDARSAWEAVSAAGHQTVSEASQSSDPAVLKALGSLRKSVEWAHDIGTSSGVFLGGTVPRGLEYSAGWNGKVRTFDAATAGISYTDMQPLTANLATDPRTYTILQRVALIPKMQADLQEAGLADLGSKSLSATSPIKGLGPQIENAVIGWDMQEKLWAAAKAKTGDPSLPAPVVRVRIIGEGTAFERHLPHTSRPTLEISVTDGQGNPYPGLSQAEMTEIWKTSAGYAELNQAAVDGKSPHQAAMDAPRNRALFVDPNAVEGPVLYAVNGDQNTSLLDELHHSQYLWGVDGSGTHTDYRFVPDDPANHFGMRVVFNNGSQMRAGESWVEPMRGALFGPKGYRVRTLSTVSGTGWGGAILENPRGVSSNHGWELAIGRSADKSHLRVDFNEHQTPIYLNERMAALEAAVAYWRSDPALASTPLMFNLLSRPWLDAYAEYIRTGRGEQGVMAQYKPDPAGDYVPFDSDAFIREYGNPGILNHIGQPAPSRMEDVAGTPDAIMEAVRMQAQAELVSASGEAKSIVDKTVQYVMDPMPSKDRRTAAYAREWLRRNFADIAERYGTNPQTGKADFADLMKSLGVPRYHWADYLLYDRALLDNFLHSRSQKDFDALVAHADKYTKGKTIAFPGFSMKETRAAIDTFMLSPEYDQILDLWRLALRAAEDEAYSAHFFNTNRSSFERSINHPVLGIYPASWAFKMAKQWGAFLYMNNSLGFYLGAAPAMVIRHMLAQQGQMAAAYNGTDIETAMTGGPLAPMIFMFNLVMPGDWSNLPFPFSRTIRDSLRGKTNLADLVGSNITSMGIFRDLRLGSETAGGIYQWLQDQLTNDTPEQFKKLSGGPIADPNLNVSQSRFTGNDPTTQQQPFTYDYFLKH